MNSKLLLKVLLLTLTGCSSLNNSVLKTEPAENTQKFVTNEDAALMGAHVTYARTGDPCFKQGLRKGQILTRIDDKPITNWLDYFDFLKKEHSSPKQSYSVRLKEGEREIKLKFSLKNCVAVISPAPPGQWVYGEGNVHYTWADGVEYRLGGARYYPERGLLQIPIHFRNQTDRTVSLPPSVGLKVGTELISPAPNYYLAREFPVNLGRVAVPAAEYQYNTAVNGYVQGGTFYGSAVTTPQETLGSSLARSTAQISNSIRQNQEAENMALLSFIDGMNRAPLKSTLEPGEFVEGALFFTVGDFAQVGPLFFVLGFPDNMSTVELPR